MPQQSPSEARARLLLSVVRGQPTIDELAAVTVVLGTLTRRGHVPVTQPQPQWSARERLLRQPVTVGPGAWRASSLPR
jgi:hypothetical protein